MYLVQEPARGDPLVIQAEDSAALRYPRESRLVRSSSEVRGRCRAKRRRSAHSTSPWGCPQSACPCAVKKSRRNVKPAPEYLDGARATAGARRETRLDGSTSRYGTDSVGPSPGDHGVSLQADERSPDASVRCPAARTPAVAEPGAALVVAPEECPRFHQETVSPCPPFQNGQSSAPQPR